MADGNKSKSRGRTPESDRWNLEDLYRNEDEWRKERDRIPGGIDRLREFKGTLSQSPRQLLRVLQTHADVEKELMRMYAYAFMLSDQDTRESRPLAMKQEMLQLATKLNTAVSWLEPEIQSIPEEKLKGFFETEPALQVYHQMIDNILRQKPHTLKDSEEEIVAQAGLLSDTAHESYNILSNADLPYPTVTLQSGENVVLNQTNYARYRTTQNREDRILIFDAFFETLGAFSRTFGTQLYGEIKKNLFYKNIRKYDSCLAASLDKNNIPETVYHQLIDNIGGNLETLYRYLDIRRRMLGVDELHYYDMYPSIVRDVDLEYSYDDARGLILESLRILGDDYRSVLERVFSDRWIDVYPGEGKRSGAYMDGIAYDVHPYILLNFKGKFNDVSTLTHELGHALHSYYSNKEQHYVNSQYPIFLAEVASTVNEALLIDHMLKTVSDPGIRLSLLGDYLDHYRATLFRQTQFAEYELLIHRKAEKDEALTGELFTEIYLDLFRKYYGHDKGVTAVDDKFGLEWAYIPHFYYNFYVFQYSTSFTASQAVVARMLDGDTELVDRYIEFLSSGSSDYAIDTLKKLGIDMTTDEPFRLTIGRMNGIMDEVERLAGLK